MKTVVFFLVAILLLLCTNACRPAGELDAPAPEGAIPADGTPTDVDEALYAYEREQMVTQTIERRGVIDEEVLRAMRSVPRHLFVPEKYRRTAYGDHPLPIGYGQTISQPFIVAWMTELLELQPGDRVLEIGTGSGYQAAVLAELGFVDVYSLEIIPDLAEQAAQNLQAAGYTGINLRQGDGYFGWEEQAPFDAIIVTAAPDHLPPPLVEQLTEDGRIVIPIGQPGGYQTLWRFVLEEGELVAYNLGGVAFVPFTRESEAQTPVP